MAALLLDRRTEWYYYYLYTDIFKCSCFNISASQQISLIEERDELRKKLDDFSKFPLIRMESGDVLVTFYSVQQFIAVVV